MFWNPISLAMNPSPVMAAHEIQEQDRHFKKKKKFKFSIRISIYI